MLKFSWKFLETLLSTHTKHCIITLFLKLGDLLCF